MVIFPRRGPPRLGPGPPGCIAAAALEEKTSVIISNIAMISVITVSALIANVLAIAIAIVVFALLHGRDQAASSGQEGT